METLYSVKATANGGRSGHVKSENGVLDLDVRVPKEMGGGAGDFANPEMLFAGGYAACFGSALDGVMRAEKITAGTNLVTAEVSIGKLDEKRYGLEVVLTARIPGLDKEKVQELMEKAHQVCPYSNATRGNITVQLMAE